jgi:hypothetical protein
MKRRQFIQRGGAALVGTALVSCDDRPQWSDLRLMVGSEASPLELTAARDAQALFGRAIGAPPPIVEDSATPGRFDVLLGTSTSSRRISGAHVPAAPGGFRVKNGDAPRVVIAGHDGEGARNGLYAFMEQLGFGFFRDTDVVPELSGPDLSDLSTGAVFGAVLESAPAFRWRGDMIWDNYLGPRRYCSSVWTEEDWERALTFMARNRMNFLEFYPPLERVYASVFPEAEGLADGSVWTAEVKHSLAKTVLTRARSLGIHCMYVLSYGAFPEPVRALFPRLEWRNGFLCAHQPELRELTAKVWRALIDELGTDHWYAIRHRGEEEQVYSDPCRSVTKAQGFLQAFSVMKSIDADARITAWTWGERLPDLFETFPPDIRAVHIRHGMADVFADVSTGREQPDGRADLPQERPWLSGQFTVFGGNETLLQTGWSDASALASDARASARDGRCEGYFQWPEWSDTSVWLSDVIAKLSWDPGSIDNVERALADYAHARHGAHATPFIEAFVPLILDGNARFMHPPRKRLLNPYELAPRCLSLLSEVRRGARAMMAPLGAHRDFIDLITWVGVRQAHALEADAYLRHAAGESAESPLEAARHTWEALHALLVQVPELSIVESVRSARRFGQLSSRIEDSFWTLSCDFYRGYPLVLSSEAIELVYLVQLDGLVRSIDEAQRRGDVASLEHPGWFWNDFHEPGWADSVRKLPSEDAPALEREMRARVRAAINDESPTGPRPIDRAPAERLLAIRLPEERESPPVLPPGRTP